MSLSLWLKARLREWLEVPSPESLPAKKPSGAMYAQVRSIRERLAETVVTAETALELAKKVDLAQGRMRVSEAVVRFDGADHHNLLVRVEELHAKLDTSLEAIGWCVVKTGDKTDLFPMDGRVRRTKRLLNARATARELDAVLAKVRQTAFAVDELKERADGAVSRMERRA